MTYEDGRDRFERLPLILSGIFGVVLVMGAGVNTAGVCLANGSRLSLEQARNLAIVRLIADQQTQEAAHQTYSKNRPDSLTTTKGEKRLLWNNRKFFRSKEEFDEVHELNEEDHRRCEEIQELKNSVRPRFSRMLGDYRAIISLCWIEYPQVEGEAMPRRDFIEKSYGVSNCGAIIPIDMEYMYRNS